VPEAPDFQLALEAKPRRARTPFGPEMRPRDVAAVLSYRPMDPATVGERYLIHDTPGGTRSTRAVDCKYSATNRR